MSDEKKQTNEQKTVQSNTGDRAAKAVAKTVYGGNNGNNNNNRGGAGRGGRGGRGDNRQERREEFDQRILDIARVTRVMQGGKRMSFRACVALGDRRGNIGIGMGKGADVTMAVNKAVNKAKKKMLNVCIVNDTIPHEIYSRVGAAKILFKPAPKGRGVKAGGVARVILELAGIKNISSKILGTNNKINNARCTIEALGKLKRVEYKKKEGDSKKVVEKVAVKETANKEIKKPIKKSVK